jgi:hypothetical protein
MRGFWDSFVPIAVVVVCGIAGTANADSITVNGTVTQDLLDSGASAVANPNLNQVRDGDEYSVLLSFSNAISAPGSYTLISILFSDPAAGASESAFISGNMTIALASPMDQFSVLGCLVDAISCFQGNELDLNFQIPAVQLNQAGVTATFIPALLPPDLLEDGGNTEIQGSIDGYSYTGGTSSTPEPSTLGLIGVSLACLRLAQKIHKKH